MINLNIDICIDIDKTIPENIDMDRAILRILISIGIFWAFENIDIDRNFLSIWKYWYGAYFLGRNCEAKNWLQVFYCAYLDLTLFNKSIWNIDCWLIDTSEKYGYQYQYEKVENIDIEKENLENIGIDIEQG